MGLELTTDRHPPIMSFMITRLATYATWFRIIIYVLSYNQLMKLEGHTGVIWILKTIKNWILEKCHITNWDTLRLSFNLNYTYIIPLGMRMIDSVEGCYGVSWGYLKSLWGDWVWKVQINPTIWHYYSILIGPKKWWKNEQNRYISSRLDFVLN